MKKIIPLFVISVVVLLFFWQVFIKSLLPIPSDTIVGLYYPFRDIYSKTNPNGVPFKNFLITDPVRQQYPWRNLSINSLKDIRLPLWNPYNLAGTPLLANFQSAVFYPFNFLFFLASFPFAWTVLIILQPLLAGIFLFLYLRNLRLNRAAGIFGAITFSLSGFFIAWLTWGTVLHSALWLPLILLSIDKIFNHFIDNQKLSIKNQLSKINIKNKKLLIWSFIFVFSLTSSFFAGHLQTFFYLFIFSTAYLIARSLQYKKIFKLLFVFLILYILFFILTFIQWYPTLEVILISARNVDIPDFRTPGWFIPWQHIVQFISPDFFGNPTTLNYWGAWNYAEFIGYVGIIPLMLVFYALFFRKDKKTLFFGAAFFVSLIFAFPTFFSQIPFDFKIPFIYTSQPTRLLFVICFSLSVLAAIGFDYFYKTKNKKYILCVLGIFSGVYVILWYLILVFHKGLILSSNLNVAKQNLILPTVLFIFSSFVIAVIFYLNKFKPKNKLTIFLFYILIAITVFDLLRFGWKFTPFTKKEYLFPNTKTISFLQKNLGNFRFMTTDSRIFPPNFSTIYKLQSIDGYDPLYLRRYGELIAASERREPNINPPFGFNRIITPHNFESKIVDLLGVKYVLSLSDIDSEKLQKVFQEVETRVYENKETLPRVFFVQKVQMAKSRDEVIRKMFDKSVNLRDTAIIETSAGVNTNPPQGCTKCKTSISSYDANRVVVETDSQSDGFLVLTDSFYPAWKARMNGKDTKIYLTNFNFRGVIVPKGNHTVEFYNKLF